MLLLTDLMASLLIERLSDIQENKGGVLEYGRGGRLADRYCSKTGPCDITGISEHLSTPFVIMYLGPFIPGKPM